MKNYVALFEKFEESYDEFHQTPNMKSDPVYHNITQDLIELANQYATSPIEIDQHTEKYETATRIKDLQNDLILKINNLEGEDIAQSFADESDELLASLAISEESMNKSKVFAKTNNIPDNGVLNQPSKKSNIEKGKSVQSLRTRKTTR
jgi:hypothetical protein